MDTAKRYLRLRHEHLARSIHDLARRQQGAIVAGAAFLGQFTLATVIPVADAMARAVSPSATAPSRTLVLAAWLVLSSLAMLALREPVFMLRARPFLSTLPIRGRLHLHADLRAVAAAYSLLWIPMVLAVWRSRSAQDAAILVALFALGIAAQSSFASMTRGAAAAFVGAFAILVAAASFNGLARFVLLAICLAIAAAAALRAHEARVALRTRVTRSRRTSRWAVRSGLALPILFADASHATWLRAAALTVVVVAGTAMASLEGQCAKAWGFLLAQAALCAWTVHRLPALADERSRAALPATFRIPAARRRIVAWAMAVALAAFLTATAVSFAGWRLECAAPEGARATAAAIVLAGVLAVLALAAIRLEKSSAWVSAIVLAATAVVVGNSI